MTWANLFAREQNRDREEADTDYDVGQALTFEMFFGIPPSERGSVVGSFDPTYRSLVVKMFLVRTADPTIY